LEEPVSPVETLWTLPEAVRITSRQQADGSWKYPGKSIDPTTGTNYSLLETYRNLRLLVDCYGFDHRSPTIQHAAEYLFSCQTSEGDLRGILGNQYMPYYHGAILALLIEAGYAEEPRVEDGLDWLLSMRQEDGGWIVPAQAVSPKQKTGDFWRGPVLSPDRALPHAHLVTGMALRALAAHPAYRTRTEVIRAGEALRRRLFYADKYNDRKAVSYWFKFQYPFWWTSLLTALDTLSRLGFLAEDATIARGLAENQIKPYPLELVGSLLYQSVVAVMNLIGANPDPAIKTTYIQAGFDIFWDGIKS
jgi:hypothetical protein